MQNDRKLALKLLQVIEAILRDPYQGMGKPEPLKYMPANTWSRRLNQEHRVVYTVSADRNYFSASSLSLLISLVRLLLQRLLGAGNFGDTFLVVRLYR